jgi:hypothetical protein
MNTQTPFFFLDERYTKAEATVVLRELLRYVHLNIFPGFLRVQRPSESERRLYIRHMSVTPHKNIETSGR